MHSRGSPSLLCIKFPKFSSKDPVGRKGRFQRLLSEVHPISSISGIFDNIQEILWMFLCFIFSSKKEVVSLYNIISVLIFISNLWSRVFILYRKQKHLVEKAPHTYDSVRIKSIGTLSFQIKETNDFFLILPY